MGASTRHSIAVVASVLALMLHARAEPPDGEIPAPPADAGAPDAAPQPEAPAAPDAAPPTEAAQHSEAEAAPPASPEPEPASDETPRPTTAPPANLDEELEGKDQTGSPPAPPDYRAPGAPSPAPPDDARRPVPDYDGRAPDGANASDYLIWVPRVVLLPVHVVLEYVVRVPVVWGITKVEQTHLPEKVEAALTWDGGNGWLYPLVYADFGVRPNAGLVLSWVDFAPRHDLYAAGFVGPGDLWAGLFELDQRLLRDESARIEWRGGYVRRPDNVYFGINDAPDPCTSEPQGCRYRTALGEARLGLSFFEEYLSGARFDFGLRHARFSTDADDPALAPATAEDLAGFEDGYFLMTPSLELAFDTRATDVEFTRGTGVRLELQGSYSVDADFTDRSWVRAGAETAAFYDFGTGQIFGLRLYGETIGNVGRAISEDERTPVPFHELIALGGSERMRSFLPGRLRGNHAWEATFEYRYPVLWALDAGFYTSIGNVYEALSDFRLERNYLNYGFLLRTSTSRKQGFEAILGWGSSRLDAPDFDAFEQFRITFGINRGF